MEAAGVQSGPAIGPGRQPAYRQVSEQVRQQEHGLEEQHAGVPDGGAATQVRQRHLREHRLYNEQQRRRCEGRCNEERRYRTVKE